MKHPLRIITLILLVISIGFAICWYIKSPDWEPALTSISLLATIIGLFVDKWLTEQERRKELLVALIHELFINLSISKDQVFNGQDLNKIKVYPRFEDTVLSAAISSGIFITKKDKELFRLMTTWKSSLINFNYRLNATDIYLFSNPTIEKITEMNSGIYSGVTRQQSVESLEKLARHLLDKYNRETKINKDTMLFEK